MSSTELFEAASISITSSDVASAIERQESHTPQGETVGPPRSQFSDAARIFAIEVLPVPREPDEQVRVVHAVLLDGVAQRPHHVLLADHVGEAARAVAAVERGGDRRHGGRSLAPGAAVSAEEKSGPCTLRRSRFPGRVRCVQLRHGRPRIARR